jgi:tRNA-dihydrouridine synthase 4
MRDPENHPLKVIARANALGRPAHIAGPMVRYSKLAFRQTIRHFDVDIVYTPMILAREFVRNQYARVSDFTTNPQDTPVIVQLGANNELDVGRAAEMLKPYCDGIGLNCGCPIKEQVREGVGAALMLKPELVASMVRRIKQVCGEQFCVEVKIRIHRDLTDTVRFVKMVEAAGADYISVHGRLKTQRSSEPPNLDAIKLVKNTVKCPVVANGDAFSLEDVKSIAEYTGVNGVMAARGILANPAMFAGYETTPWHAVELFWDYVTAYGLPYRLTQHHFSEMLDKTLSKKQKKSMNECQNLVQLIQWFDDRFELRRRTDAGFALDRAFEWRKRDEEL